MFVHVFVHVFCSVFVHVYVHVFLFVVCLSMCLLVKSVQRMESPWENSRIWASTPPTPLINISFEST